MNQKRLNQEYLSTKNVCLKENNKSVRKEYMHFS